MGSDVSEQDTKESWSYDGDHDSWREIHALYDFFSSVEFLKLYCVYVVVEAFVPHLAAPFSSGWSRFCIRTHASGLS
jgi:uncharacterized membrane protein (DUF485 family)